jgi:hypothetical protein
MMARRPPRSGASVVVIAEPDDQRVRPRSPLTTTKATTTKATTGHAVKVTRVNHDLNDSCLVTTGSPISSSRAGLLLFWRLFDGLPQWVVRASNATNVSIAATGCAIVERQCPVTVAATTLAPGATPDRSITAVLQQALAGIAAYYRLPNGNGRWSCGVDRRRRQVD